jgi:hypothetical protein
MKKSVLILLLISLELLSYSQVEYSKPVYQPKHMPGDIMISAAPNIMIHTRLGVQFTGGAKIQFFLGKRFSIDADIVLGKNYLHMSPGLIGVPVGLAGLTLGFEDTDGLTSFMVSAIALALSFEHVSYHIPVKDNFEISPYISALRLKSYMLNNRDFDYMNPDLNMISDQLCFGTGIQVNKYFGRFALSPYAEYSIGYRDHHYVIACGVYFGINLNSKLLNGLSKN